MTAGGTASTHGPHRGYGIGLVAASAVLWSTAGLFVRWAGLDAWTMVAWRSLFAACVLGAAALIQARRRGVPVIGRIGQPEAMTVAVSSLSGIAYVLALRLTTVANVMTVYATLPFITSAIAGVWVGEAFSRRFVIAGAVVVAAIALAARAAASVRDLWGLVAALAMTCGFALQLVNARAHPGLDMTVLGAIAAAACIPIAGPFMQLALPTWHQLAAAAAYGALTTGLAYVLAMAGGG